MASVSGQALRQVGYVNKAFWRNPASAFFTFAFPLMFLVIFTTLLGNGEVPLGGEMVKTSTYYVPAMAAFAVISACYTNIAISVVFQREQGILKRVRGTPVPGGAYLSGRVIHAVAVAVLLVAICIAFGAIAYGASLPDLLDLAQMSVMLLVGAAAFTALGLAVTAIIPNADAGPPIVNATILPLLFLSGVFIPVGDDAPAWIEVLGSVFPIKPFVDGVVAGYLGTGFSWPDVAIVAAWGVVGLAVAAKTFTWEPRR